MQAEGGGSPKDASQTPSAPIKNKHISPVN